MIGTAVTAMAALRDGLAAQDWRTLNVVFRAYVEGQEALKSLGLDEAIERLKTEGH